MKGPRIGRPRSKPEAAKALVTRRVRRLVDLAHDGNVHEASKASGLAYATIRDLYSGRSTNPSLRTLEKLANAYGIFTGWFSDEKQQEEVPAAGYRGFVSAMDGSSSRAKRREILIPFSAWPFPSIYVRLGEYLESLPVSDQRPIIGNTTDPVEVSRIIADHLLASLLDAEKVTGVELIPSEERLDRVSADRFELWTTQLRRLGIHWEALLDEFLPKRWEQ